MENKIFKLMDELEEFRSVSDDEYAKNSIGYLLIELEDLAKHLENEKEEN